MGQCALQSLSQSIGIHLGDYGNIHIEAGKFSF